MGSWLRSGSILISTVVIPLRFTVKSSISSVEPCGLKLHCCRTISFNSEPDPANTANSWDRSAAAYISLYRKLLLR